MKINYLDEVDVEVFIERIRTTYQELGITKLYKPTLYTQVIQNNEPVDILEDGESKELYLIAYDERDLLIFENIMRGTKFKDIAKEFETTTKQIKRIKEKLIQIDEHIVNGQLCEENAKYLLEIGYITQDEYDFFVCFDCYVGYTHVFLYGNEKMSVEKFKGLTEGTKFNFEEMFENLQQKCILYVNGDEIVGNPHIFNIGGDNTRKTSAFFSKLKNRKRNRKPIVFPIPFKEK